MGNEKLGDGWAPEQLFVSKNQRKGKLLQLSQNVTLSSLAVKAHRKQDDPSSVTSYISPLDTLELWDEQPGKHAFHSPLPLRDTYLIIWMQQLQ